MLRSAHGVSASCSSQPWSLVFCVFELCELVAESESVSSLLMKLKSILDKIKITFWQQLPKGRQKMDVLRSCVFRSVPQPRGEGVLVPRVLQVADYPACFPADQLLT